MYEDEENFEEAGRAVNTVVVPTTIPSSTKEILDDPMAETISASSSAFWVLAHSLRSSTYLRYLLLTPISQINITHM